jgi:hypothetical protein
LFRFWDGFLSDFAFFDEKSTGKPHDITIEHTHYTCMPVAKLQATYAPQQKKRPNVWAY